MTEEEENALVWLLDQAFDGDPILGYALGDPARQKRAATVLHSASLRYTQRFGVVDVAPEQAGVALWLPPGETALRFSGMAQTGFLSLAGVLGARLPRLLAVDRLLSQQHQKHAPEPHWYLFFLAVDPAYQRRGVGGALLEQGVARADASGVPVYLETQERDNLAFYQKHGFRVVEEATLGNHLTNWSLRRG